MESIHGKENIRPPVGKIVSRAVEKTTRRNAFELHENRLAVTFLASVTFQIHDISLPGKSFGLFLNDASSYANKLVYVLAERTMHIILRLFG